MGEYIGMCIRVGLFPCLQACVGARMWLCLLKAMWVWFSVELLHQPPSKLRLHQGFSSLQGIKKGDLS